MNNKKIDIYQVANEARNENKKKCNVINATVGTLYNENNEFISFETVKKVLESLNDEDVYSYATTGGDNIFQEAVFNYCFKNLKKDIINTTNAWAIPTPGGTGALFASMFYSMEKNKTIIIPDLCWEPYLSSAEVNNYKVLKYELLKENKFNLEGFKLKINQVAFNDNKVVTIINDPCNNPTGYTLSISEFKEVISVFNNLKVKSYFIYDIAYFNYYDKEEEVLEKFRLLASLNELVTVFICFSASKSLCIYGLRLGALIMFNKNLNRSIQAKEHIIKIARTHWSNVNKGAINMFIKINNDKLLFTDLISEQKKVRDILLKRINLFLKEAKKHNLKVYSSTGGFFLCIPSKDPYNHFEKLKNEDVYVIPLDNSIRIGICSVPSLTIINLVNKIAKVMND